MTWAIALGNLRRHGMRSAIIVLVIGLSVAVMIFVVGMIEGMRQDFFSSMVATQGHIVVDHAGADDALDPLSLEVLIADWEAIQGSIYEHQHAAAVRAIEPALQFGALLLANDVSVPMQGVGVFPDTGFYADVRRGLIEGSFLTDRGILVSSTTAAMLSVSLGDEVAVLVEDATGAPYYLSYEVGGVFQSDSPDFDASQFLVHHESAGDLLYVDDQTRELRVTLDNDELTDAVLLGIRTSLAERPDLRIRGWREVNGGLVVLIEMFDVVMWAINLLVVIVASTVIANAILMNIFDKLAEFGTMRAIGLTRGGQRRLILAEGVIYGVTGSTLGVALGLPIVLFFQVNGMNWGEISDAMGLGSAVYTQASLGGLASSFALGTGIAVAGSIFAARASNRQTIIQSLRGSQ